MSQKWRSTLDPAYHVMAQERGGLWVCDWYWKDEPINEGFSCTLKHLEDHFWREA
jgi:hypothetical protein